MNNDLVFFGEKNEFAIAYRFLSHPYGDESGLALDSWGEAFIWVKGRNILSYKNRLPSRTYQWNLSHLLEFFCYNLEFQVLDDPFPIEVAGRTSLELLKNASVWEHFNEEEIAEFMASDDGMEYISVWVEWSQRHSLLQNRGGSSMPNAFVRLRENEVEICWDNSKIGAGRKMFQHRKGLAFVDVELYKQTVLDCCNSFIFSLYRYHPSEMLGYKIELDKAQLAA